MAKLLMMYVISALVYAGESIKPVSSNYPGLTKVSSYLATKYETDNLLKGTQEATDMILVAALAERTSADIVSQHEAKMPFGGFQIPIENTEYQQGHLYILCGLVEQKSSSHPVTKMDQWPMWQLVCGKLFRSDPGKIYSVRYISPLRENVPLTAEAVQDVVAEAVKGLSQLPLYKGAGAVHKLAAVLAVERQTVDQQYFKELALTRIPNDVQVYYVYFLTSDTTRDTAPPRVHAAAVMRTPTQLKLVRQISLEEPGFTLIRAETQISGVKVFDFTPQAQNQFRIALAKAAGEDLEADNVKITSFDAAGAQENDHHAGIQVDFTLTIAGSATQIKRNLLQAAGFAKNVSMQVRNRFIQRVLLPLISFGCLKLRAAGMKQVGANAVTLKHFSLLSNELQLQDTGFSMMQILVIIGSFVLGVAVTTAVGVVGLRENRQKLNAMRT
jgi:hypothetical protein